MTVFSARVVMLVKALPRPSQAHGETVCCAGITADRKWKRLYPVRFRRLREESSFKRWDWVRFDYLEPTHDRRPESCRVHEDSLVVDGSLRRSERARFLDAMVLGSVAAAVEQSRSLALIRPRHSRFTYRRKSTTQIERERQAYQRAASQTSLLDADLAMLEPSPFEFRFRFEDGFGMHNYCSADWEAHAMFWRERQRRGEHAALRWMDEIFNEHYPRDGMVFAVGNMAKRPQTWQLLGVIRLNELDQSELSL